MLVEEVITNTFSELATQSSGVRLSQKSQVNAFRHAAKNNMFFLCVFTQTISGATITSESRKPWAEPMCENCPFSPFSRRRNKQQEFVQLANGAKPTSCIYTSTFLMWLVARLNQGFFSRIERQPSDMLGTLTDFQS